MVVMMFGVIVIFFSCARVEHVCRIFANETLSDFGEEDELPKSLLSSVIAGSDLCEVRVGRVIRSATVNDHVLVNVLLVDREKSKGKDFGVSNSPIAPPAPIVASMYSPSTTLMSLISLETLVPVL
jgi:hypothetical protein